MKYLLSILAAVFVMKAEAQSINIKTQQNKNLTTISVYSVTPGSLSFSGNTRDSIYLYSQQGKKFGEIDCSAGFTDGVLELYAPGINPLYVFDSEEKCMASIEAIESALSQNKTVAIVADILQQTVKEINYYNSCK